jgi:alpha-L-arabinofuranosidase
VKRSLKGENAISSVNGRILTAAAMNVCNTFEQPEQIKPCNFEDINTKENGISMVLPAKSVLALEISFK